MSAQTLLDFSPHRLARRTDPSTSHAAAARVGSFAGAQGARILELLRAHGPMSPEQIAEMMQIAPYAVRKRLPELQDANLAAPTGDTVPTASGRAQRVWRIV
jgi:predicted ArsR family transcriptional regulator